MQKETSEVIPVAHEEEFIESEEEVEKDTDKRKSCCRRPDKRITNVLVNPRFHGTFGRIGSLVSWQMGE